MPDLTALPDLPVDEAGPVFAEPWEAQAFAMAVHLHDQRVFTWTEWATALSTQIAHGADRTYYEHWLAALEALVAEKALTTPEALAARKAAWQVAAERTPHGTAITLETPAR